jgi:lipopolysaccharide/colanic/teichoic acid biosynthesis glycosyltransferase
MPRVYGLTPTEQFLKRGFDIVVSLVGLTVLFPVILAAWVAASLSTGKSGFFLQRRVGRNGRLFSVIKLRSMRDVSDRQTTVTAQDDPRITRVGAILRRTKLDELPQLINVLLGQMSFVGPRPDVPGFADALTGDDRIILSLRPGITGPATLAFRDEESQLAAQSDPERFNREVIWPKKVLLNRAYIANYSLLGDIRYLWRTLF